MVDLCLNTSCKTIIISSGLVGELEDMEDVNEQQCLDCIARHPDEIVGVKVRLTAQIANKGKHEQEAYRYHMYMNKRRTGTAC